MVRHTWEHFKCGKKLKAHCGTCGACPGSPHTTKCKYQGLHRGK